MYILTTLRTKYPKESVKGSKTYKKFEQQHEISRNLLELSTLNEKY